MSAKVKITGYNRKAFETAVTECLGCEVTQGENPLTNEWTGAYVRKNGILVGAILPDPVSDFGCPSLTLSTGWLEAEDIGRMLQMLGDAYGRG